MAPTDRADFGVRAVQRPEPHGYRIVLIAGTRSAGIRGDFGESRVMRLSGRVGHRCVA